MDRLRSCDGVTDVRACCRIDSLSREVVDQQADVVIFDVSGEGALGEARALGELCPQVCLIALGVAPTAEAVIACADAGFAGYIPHHASLEDLCVGIRLALRGHCHCPPEVSGSLMQELRRRRRHEPASEASEPLTPRESEVLQQVARGMSNKEVAVALSLSVATVKNHLHSVFAKLRVSGRTEALAKVRNEPWLVRTA